jgi:hypothetical protein
MGPGAIYAVTLWHAVPTVTGGTVNFSSNGSYTTSLVLTTPSATHFSQTCLQKASYFVDCAHLAMDLASFYAAKKKSKFNSISCAPSADSGCDCNYVYEVDVLDQGTYVTSSSGMLVESTATYTYDGTAVPEYQPQAPMAIDYCASGGALTMSGNNGTSLSGVQGLRMLTLLPSTAPPPSGDGGP